MFYIIVSKLIYSHSIDKDRIFYYAMKCSIVYKIDKVSNQLVVELNIEKIVLYKKL